MSYIFNDEGKGFISVGTFVVEDLEKLIQYRDSLLLFPFQTSVNLAEFYSVNKSSYDEDTGLFSFRGNIINRFELDNQSMVEYRDYYTSYVHTILLLTCLINELDSGKNYKKLISNKIYHRFFQSCHFDDSLIFEEVWDVCGDQLLKLDKRDKNGNNLDYMAFKKAIECGFIQFYGDSMPYSEALNRGIIPKEHQYNGMNILSYIAGSTKLLKRNK